jgi:BirA family biotin operon repressor/biotin-[acetyl-CoA-carboxylase] ligase
MSELIFPKTSRCVAGRILMHLDEIDSTNTFLLKNQALLEQDGLVAYSDRQTWGRGRMERSWSGGAPDKKHLFCSIAIHARPFLRHIPSSITIILGLAVYRALSHLGVSNHLIKWPNDILASGKKLCGILCEGTSFGELNVTVAGIGMNLEGDAEQFGPALHNKVNTLEIAAGIRIERDQVLDILLDEIDKILLEAERNGPRPLFGEWETSSGIIGKSVSFKYDGKIISGTVAGLDNSGRLVIETVMGPISLVSGEISLF